MLPYVSEKYYYTGISDEYFSTGKQYTVIETGRHWFKEWGYGAWMTTDEYPDTKDIDFGCFVPYEDFGKRKNFEKY